VLEIDLSILKQKEEIRTAYQKTYGFPEEIEVAAKNLEPHRITYYLGELVADFHRFITEHRMVSDQAPPEFDSSSQIGLYTGRC